MRIGTVARLFRYPVKSMRGEELTATPVTLQGLPGDRRFAFVQAESRGPFPWLTGRQVNELLCYAPFYPDGFDGSGREPAPRVRTPDGTEHGVQDPALREELEARLGKPLFLLQDYRGSYDVAQVSLFSLATAEAIGERAGLAVDPRRFRANIYVAPAEPSVPEADWVGKVLAIGEELRIIVTEADQRCVMTTLDPDTAAREPAVFETIVNAFGNRAGVYASVMRPGPVRVGDAIVMLT